ncbi:branched-chain amino acid ABC transporter permease [Ferrovibrio sp.]|uniref:branched-chain amino acid ABC transporter permease n=1 Tax=Ferrovibrio sp. TaxID=1917215 RepID=UPI00311E4133
MAPSDRRNRHILVAALGMLILVGLPLVVDLITLLEVSIYIVYAILALSLGFIWGYGGILCFGQAAFFGLGAYTYAVAAINVGESTGPFLLAIVLPGAFAFLLGAMMFYGRISDVYMGVMTLVVTLILFKFINSTANETWVVGTARLGGFNGIPSFPTLNIPGDPGAVLDPEQFFYVAMAFLIGVYFLLHWLMTTHFGRVVVAIRENETRAELLGYDVRLYKTAVFAIGGAVGGLAGALFANWGNFVSPGLFGLAQSATIIIWVIVGGLGTLLGPVIGAVLIQYITTLLGQQGVINNAFVLGAILVLFVLLLPKGLAPAIMQIVTRRRRPARSKPQRGGHGS